MSVELFLLSMQAAGVVGDMLGTSGQIRVGRAGRDLELSQIETRLEEERLAAALSSVDAMKALRQTLASQRAISAARGTNVGAGSALYASANAQSEHSNDERVKRMNLLSKEASLRAGGALTGLHQAASETQLGQALSQRLFNQIPFGEMNKQLGERKKTTTPGKTPNSPAEVNKTFGYR